MMLKGASWRKAVLCFCVLTDGCFPKHTAPEAARDRLCSSFQHQLDSPELKDKFSTPRLARPTVKLNSSSVSFPWYTEPQYKDFVTNMLPSSSADAEVCHYSPSAKYDWLEAKRTVCTELGKARVKQGRVPAQLKLAHVSIHLISSRRQSMVLEEQPRKFFCSPMPLGQEDIHVHMRRQRPQSVELRSFNK